MCIRDSLYIDGVEISAGCKKETILPFLPKKRNISIIRSSDAHYLDQVGKVVTSFEMEHRSFKEIKMALQATAGRSVIN